MAKKKTTARRVPRSTTPRMYGDGKPARPAQSGTETASVVAPRATGAVRGVAAGTRAAGLGRSSVPLSTEYRYVLGDLRRLGILAAGVFAVLVVLGLIVR